jgi:hypothetical protein
VEEVMQSLQPLIQSQILTDPAVTGVLAVRTVSTLSPLVDGFDVLLLVVTVETLSTNYINHYSRDGLTIQERRISKDALSQWIMTGDNRSVIEWLLHGEICADRDSFLESTRQRLLEYPLIMKDQKLFIEFSHFLRSYLHSKQYLKEGHMLDAYASVLEALLQWARIAIIEQGFHPEVTVWQHVRKINPGIYKLYEELTQNEETLEQRVQLIHLACEFNVMSKMESCCNILIQVLKSRAEPFSPFELKYHPELRPLHVDLALVLKNLIKRGLIQEVLLHNEEQDELALIEVRYTIAKE